VGNIRSRRDQKGWGELLVVCLTFVGGLRVSGRPNARELPGARKAMDGGADCSIFPVLCPSRGKAGIQGL